MSTDRDDNRPPVLAHLRFAAERSSFSGLDLAGGFVRFTGPISGAPPARCRDLDRKTTRRRTCGNGCQPCCMNWARRRFSMLRAVMAAGFQLSISACPIPGSMSCRSARPAGTRRNFTHLPACRHHARSLAARRRNPVPRMSGASVVRQALWTFLAHSLIGGSERLDVGVLGWPMVTTATNRRPRPRHFQKPS